MPYAKAKQLPDFSGWQFGQRQGCGRAAGLLDNAGQRKSEALRNRVSAQRAAKLQREPGPMLQFAHINGVWLVAALLAIECSGIPVPGETTLIAGALYAGTLHTLDIGRFIAAAAIGAIAGNIVGYLIGRLVGYRILVQYGSRVGFSEGRFKIGHYLFRRYGIAAVIAGRFLPLWRSALPILAGANRMAFWPFIFATIAGGIAWVTCVGIAAFYFGAALVHLSATAMILVGSGVTILAVFITIYIRRHEAELLIKAQQEIPGCLPKSSFRRARSTTRFADGDSN